MTFMTPSSLIHRCADERGGRILRALCAYCPAAVTRAELMRYAGIHVREMGEVSAYASFAYWIDQINDALPSYGWRIEGGKATYEQYRLVPA